MRDEIDSLGERVGSNLRSVYPDGYWSAKSVKVDGIITGGFDRSDVTDMIKVTILTYYDIPPQYCEDGSSKSSGKNKISRMNFW